MKHESTDTANSQQYSQCTARFFREQLINSTAARISFSMKFAMSHSHSIGGNYDSDEH